MVRRTKEEIESAIWGVIISTNDPVRWDRAQHDLTFLKEMSPEEVARPDVQQVADQRYPRRVKESGS